jgi:hypothetical protein
MDPVKNPFSPGAGSPPPELVGRDPRSAIRSSALVQRVSCHDRMYMSSYLY